MAAAILTVGLALAGQAVVSGAAQAGPSIVVDMRSGKVLSQNDAFRRWYPASLTKLMTVYVVFRAIQAGQLSLNSPITVTQEATREPPSKMGYPAGTVLTVDNALKILMVKSANDIATSVADSVAGSVPNFAARMNAEARRLGLIGTHYVNAHGLHDPDHYTTARDLAVLTMHLRAEFPQYAGYFSLDGIRSGKSAIPNHNNLIGRFDGTDGMKTGYTCDAGFNVVATADRNGRELMAVVIGEKTVDERDEKAAALLAHGFKTGGFGAARLDTMPVSGRMIYQATDMRDAICSKEARQERARIIKAQGGVVTQSPYMHDFDHTRQFVQITLGGASMPARQYADVPAAAAGVPIPTPRPDYPLQAQGD